MKKLLLATFISLALFSCKNEDDSNVIIILSGSELTPSQLNDGTICYTTTKTDFRYIANNGDTIMVDGYCKIDTKTLGHVIKIVPEDRLYCIYVSVEKENRIENYSIPTKTPLTCGIFDFSELPLISGYDKKGNPTYKYMYTVGFLGKYMHKQELIEQYELEIDRKFLK